MPDTLKAQHSFVTKGHCLYSDMGRILCSIVEDTAAGTTPCAAPRLGAVARKYGVASYQEQRNDFHRNAHDSFLVESASGASARATSSPTSTSSARSGRRMTGAVVRPRAAKPGARRPARRDEHARAVQHLPAPARTRRRLPAQAGALRDLSMARRPRRRSARLSAPENERGFENNRIFHSAAATGAIDDQDEPARSARARYREVVPAGDVGCTRCARARRCASSISKATRRSTRLFYNADDPSERYSAATRSARRATSI